MNKKRIIAALIALESLVFCTSNVKASKDIKDTAERVEESYTFEFAYIKNKTSIFAQDLNEEIVIDKYQKVLVVDHAPTNVVSLVETENGNIGYVYNKDLVFMPKDYVEVDLGDQTLYLYKDNQLFFTTPVITGKPSTPTPEEYGEIRYKKTNTYLRGATWCSYVNRWMPFDENQRGLHDASWQTHGFGGDVYKTYGSHGCVNISPECIDDVYNNVEAGTKVLIHK